MRFGRPAYDRLSHTSDDDDEEEEEKRMMMRDEERNVSLDKSKNWLDYFESTNSFTIIFARFFYSSFAILI